MKLLVNVRGTNGSGKSTIPLSMMDDPEMYIIEKPFKGKNKKILTVFPTYGWAALGGYLTKTGGLDCLPNKEIKHKVLWYALKHLDTYNIILEGVIDSTIFSTYRDLFREVKNKYPNREVVILNLTPPLNICLDRVQKRNGGKSVKEEQIESKYNTVVRNAEKFKHSGFRSIRWNNSKISKDRVLEVFLRRMEKYGNFSNNKR